MELRDLDLNLLLVLAELVREKSVSKAAENLGMSQPGMSNALNRLRALLGDDLLLRTGRGMQPTPYAERLAEPLNEALRLIHGVVNLEMDFDPARSNRSFTIAMTDIGEIDFLANLMRALERVAPDVSISTVRKGESNLKDELETGAVDLAIGWLPDLNAGMFQRRLTASQYVCAFRKGHALDKGSITLEEFARADHLVVLAPHTGHMMIEHDLGRLGVRRNVKLRIPHFAAVGHILSETDMIAALPGRLVNHSIVPFNLAWAPLPIKLDPIPLNVFWSAKYHRDPANQWLRAMMFDTFSEGAPHVSPDQAVPLP
ncbi:LysR family transcriptional regulator [Paraburkholderia terrae]|uniref:LysR family transcriptional regulator n=1 Tax=Paraburkholderia terrae TaxID=311230 RepID=A0A2I8F1L0_9BURK|nr:LysR family transcriptional regulator [Paraburkholderia terrae]AUT65532.1 LysR family transcriptional regulator [Paraburkholderia terrae]BCZ82807.1 LysR family transcriptional regulator [Paraburkholderia terrae]BDC43893.1 LysR family transcriptional regulator [Paraburkholderia terrae]